MKGYDLFDAGRKRALLREREAQLAHARENLARVKDQVELRVQTAYNRLERTRQLISECISCGDKECVTCSVFRD